MASFKIISLEESDPYGGFGSSASSFSSGFFSSATAGNDCGPYGEQDDEQVRLPPFGIPSTTVELHYPTGLFNLQA